MLEEGDDKGEREATQQCDGKVRREITPTRATARDRPYYTRVGLSSGIVVERMDRNRRGWGPWAAQER